MAKNSFIPKAEKPNNSTGIVPPPLIGSSENLSFSFAALETTEYFNLDGTCINWASDLFEMLKYVSREKVSTLLSGRFSTYRIHQHTKAKPPHPFPQGVEQKDCYQIRISKSKGGIHGIFRDNVFYVIWLDPLHNLYPDDRYGGLRKITPPSTCCKEREEIIADLQTTIDEKNKEIEDLNKTIDEFLQE